MQKSDPGRIAKERERRRREKERKKNKEKFRRKHCSNTPFFFSTRHQNDPKAHRWVN